VFYIFFCLWFWICDLCFLIYVFVLYIVLCFCIVYCTLFFVRFVHLSIVLIIFLCLGNDIGADGARGIADALKVNRTVHTIILYSMLLRIVLCFILLFVYDFEFVICVCWYMYLDVFVLYIVLCFSFVSFIYQLY